MWLAAELCPRLGLHLPLSGHAGALVWAMLPPLVWAMLPLMQTARLTQAARLMQRQAGPLAV